MSTGTDFIEARLKQIGRSLDWFRSEMGMSKQTWTNWRGKRGVSNQIETLTRMAELLQVPLDILSPQLRPSNAGLQMDSSGLTLEYAGRPRSDKRVPVVGTAKLGGDGYYYELETPTGHGDGYVEAFSADRNAYAVRVKGDSMYPAIRHGEIVVVEPHGQLVAGERVLIGLHDGRKMVKELVTGREDSVTVVSVNGGDRLTFEREEIEYIHAVAMIVSASKWRPE